jgi:hypothetical protein
MSYRYNHPYRITPIDEPIPGTSLRAVWLLTGVGADAVFSSTAMLEEWLARVGEEADDGAVIQLDFLDKAA